MPSPLPQSNEGLKKQVSQHVQSGNIADAKRIALQISEPMLQRQAWLEIFYALRDRFNDLQGIKEIILSLPSSEVWLGSWVHDFVLDTARLGDIAGAKAVVERIPQDHLRGNFYSLIASVQAQTGDYQGAQLLFGSFPLIAPGMISG